MKQIKYLVEFFLISILFFIFRIIGYRNASSLGEKIGITFGPFFRNNKIILNNLIESKIGSNDSEREKIIKTMWGNYGRILAEYPYIKDFRNSKLKKYISVSGKDILENLKMNNKKVLFVSGHFNNFELMALEIDKSGIDLAAIYRPLNNIFLNKTMENIRKKYICKNQVKKGKSGTRKIIEHINNGNSVAIMIDQRVSEGKKCNFFGRKAFTTTIPAQLIKKYEIEVVPVYIERKEGIFFNVIFSKPILFDNKKSVEEITEDLNIVLEKMILNNPGQWIWSHNRWK